MEKCIWYKRIDPVHRSVSKAVAPRLLKEMAAVATLKNVGKFPGSLDRTGRERVRGLVVWRKLSKSVCAGGVGVCGCV